jgi:hypothetical protein
MAQAKVLRLLRHDARMWWYFQTLRNQGNTQRAIKLERESIRNQVRFLRKAVRRQATTHRDNVIEFLDRPGRKPFDLSHENMDGSYVNSYTVTASGCHPGGFAAFVYCYAHRIGLKFKAKAHDTI